MDKQVLGAIRKYFFSKEYDIETFFNNIETIVDREVELSRIRTLYKVAATICPDCKKRVGTTVEDGKFYHWQHGTGKWECLASDIKRMVEIPPE